MCFFISRRKWGGEQLSTITQLLHLAIFSSFVNDWRQVKGQEVGDFLCHGGRQSTLCCVWELWYCLGESFPHTFPLMCYLIMCFCHRICYRNFMDCQRVGCNLVTKQQKSLTDWIFSNLERKLERTMGLNKLINLSIQKYLIQFTKRE